MPKKKPQSTPPELLTLPHRLAYARTRAGMTQTALAEKCGVDTSQISRIESEERAAGLEAATIIRIARALGVPVGWLAADEGEPGPIAVFREGADRRRRGKTSGDHRS